MENPSNNFIKAVRLFNNPDGSCTFTHGKLPTGTHLSAQHFFAHVQIFEYQKHIHPAPRRQYVVTLAGKLRFKVTNGDTFIVEPGTILIAEDTEGPGHTWELVDCTDWVRIYIPLPEGADSQFIAE